MVFNVIIDLIALIVIIIIRINGAAAPNDRIMQKLIDALMINVGAVLVLDIPAWVLDGQMFAGADILLWILDSAYYAAQITYCWLWLLFSDYWSNRDAERIKRIQWLYAIPAIIELVLIFTTYFTHWVFDINESNVYVRGSLYFPNLIPYLFYVISAIVVMIISRHRAKDPIAKRQSLSLLAFMFLPICGMILQAFMYGIAWQWAFTALSLLMIYISIQQQSLSDERIISAKNEKEASDARVAIMLSQIQPHFLYNSLTGIYELCDCDPKKAQQAIGEFSRYLRFNMDSLTRKNPVSFETELNHIRNYLSLEKMRFEQNLNIVYDIEATDFYVPVLSIQPLVENAVKHGVGKKAEGGTVSLTVRKEESEFVIIVKDDGIGFLADEKPASSNTHIGIENIKARLSSMCGATVEIISEKNVGTTATVRIPRDTATA